jgi:hypothetical protein
MERDYFNQQREPQSYHNSNALISREHYRSLVKPWEFDFTKSIDGLNGCQMSQMFEDVYGRTHVAGIKEFCFKRLGDLRNYTILDIGSGPFIGLKAFIEHYYHGPMEYIAVDRSSYFLEHGSNKYHEHKIKTFRSMEECSLSSCNGPVLVIMSYLFQNIFFNEVEFINLLDRLQKSGREIILYIQDTSSQYFNEFSVTNLVKSSGYEFNNEWEISLNPSYKNSEYKNYVRHVFFSNSVRTLPLEKGGIDDELIF